MIVVRQRPALLAGAALFTLLTLLYLASSSSTRPSSYIPSFKLPSSSSSQPATNSRPSYSSLYGPDYHGSSTPSTNRVTNSTLGFSKIFVVGLPERSDKRDALTLASSLTGFKLDWIPGVRGESIPDKAVPLGVDRKKLMETNLGSWRGHMDAVRRIVDEGLESALIMEDDMDWDVRLKPLLEVVATGVRSVSSSLPDGLFPTGRATPGVEPSSPYGDDWDVLWLGHCGEPFPEDLPEVKELVKVGEGKGEGEGNEGLKAMRNKFTVLNDATVPPFGHVTGIVNFTAYPEHTRWVHVTAAPICTFAYALSQKGARKVLFDLSVDRLSGPFDNALAWLCRRAVVGWPKLLAAAGGEGAAKEEEVKTDKDRGLDAKCFSVTPPVFFHHKARGPVSGDSDIQVVDGGRGEEKKEQKIREKGTTENIVWSARLNVRNMLLGREMESQW
ncbi:glycosyltransferase family 25 protein [Coniochaeta sp. 2T2.1]|nr:glycosyltransferase family 25 protein [Coniochaeta sp. 2T2.1]